MGQWEHGLEHCEKKSLDSLERERESTGLANLEKDPSKVLKRIGNEPETSSKIAGNQFAKDLESY